MSRRQTLATLSTFTGPRQLMRITLAKLSLCLQSLLKALASEWVNIKLNTRLRTDRAIRRLALLPSLFQVGRYTSVLLLVYTLATKSFDLF